MLILGIDGSPVGGGRTLSAIKEVLAAVAEDAETEVASLAGAEVESIILRMVAADAVVCGSPIYRASFAYPLKALLDRLPRGMWGETSAPLQGKAAVIVATGASLHHFLALDDLRNVLAGFFACHVVPPGLYVPREGFDEASALTPPYADQANLQGRALVALTRALESSPALRQLRPQA